MTTRSLPLDYDIVVYSSTSFRREFRWLPDGVTPMDFTGWNARLMIGKALNPADLELTNAPGDGIELTTTGQIIVTLTPAQTASLRNTVSFYNLDLIEPDGFVRRFLRGRVNLVVDVKPL